MGEVAFRLVGTRRAAANQKSRKARRRTPRDMFRHSNLVLALFGLSELYLPIRIDTHIRMNI